METLKQLDTELFLYLNNLGTTSWDSFWIWMTDEWVSIPVYILLSWLIYWKTGLKRAFISGITIVVMLAVTYGVSKLFKYGVMRPRPCTMGFDMRFPLQTDCGDYGFFSSHASVGSALIFFAGLILKKYYRYIFWPLLIWLALFGYSRIYVGKHYPGDILAGLCFGIFLGVLFYRIRIYLIKKYNL